MVKKEIPFEKSFASNKFVKNWSKTNLVRPADVRMHSHKKFTFDCKECGHSYSASLVNICNGMGCPFCANRRLCNDDECKTCLAKSFASHKYVKYWSESNNVRPRDVFRYSDKKYNFDCKCGHTYSVVLRKIIRGTRCPFCSGRTVCGNKGCKSCFDKSFASHEYSKFWSLSNTIQPISISRCSSKKFAFDCNICKHTYSAVLNNIYNGSTCSYCTNRKLCDDEDCTVCFEKSFASHTQAKIWNYKNGINPRYVFKGTRKVFLFDCNTCKHVYSAKLVTICQGAECPYCANRRLCDDKECDMCFNKSMASQPAAKFWLKKNKLNPRNVFKCSQKKYWFKCGDCDNEFDASPANIYSSNTWCPLCKNKTEKKLYNILSKTYSSLIHNFRPEWSINKETERILPFDFAIPEYKVIIELDGAQHFKQVFNWQSPEFNQERDIYKMKLANLNGYSIIRVIQEEVWKNKSYNYGKIIDTITSISKSKKKPTTNYFICDNNEYDVYNC